jgi:hypothetical protein
MIPMISQVNLSNFHLETLFKNAHVLSFLPCITQASQKNVNHDHCALPCLFTTSAGAHGSGHISTGDSQQLIGIASRVEAQNLWQLSSREHLKLPVAIILSI